MLQGPKYPTSIGRCTAMPSLRDRVKGQRELPIANTTGADAFIEAANEVRRDATQQPWHAFEKKAVPRTTFNLRLNDYELALLRWLAEQREESMRVGLVTQQRAVSQLQAATLRCARDERVGRWIDPRCARGRGTALRRGILRNGKGN